MDTYMDQRPGQSSIAEYHLLIAELLAIPNALGLADQGDYQEAALLHQHYDYLERGMALVLKLGVPIRGTGRGVSRPWHGAKTLADFAGWVLSKDGLVIPVIFEAKRKDVAKGSKWQWQCSQTRDHQRLAMQLFERWLGGWGFQLVNLEDGGQILGDVRVLRGSQLVPGTSIDLRECPSIGLGLGCDWLPVVQEIFAR